MAEINNTVKSIMSMFVIVIGLMNDDSPKIIKILNKLEPKTLPNASCALPLTAANIHVINSGNEVPMATNVMDITASGIPH